MSIKILDDSSKNAYEQVAKHPLQSWAWGEARMEMNTRVIRFGLYDGPTLESVYQMSLHPLPAKLGYVGYIPRSPVPQKQILQYLQDYGKSNNIAFIKFEPYEERTDKLKATLIDDFSLSHSIHPLFPDWTQFLDIDKSEDELLNSFKSKTRYNIRLAQKKGVVIKEMSNEEGFNIFAKLYFETCKRQNYFGHNLRYHKTVWNSMRKQGGHILIAFYQGIPLGAYELFFYKKRMYYVYGGTSTLHKNVMASNLLMWESIRLAKRKGAVMFDMWGSLPPDYPQDHPWAGFTRFKEGYATRFVEMIGSYDLVINPTLYSLYNLLHSLRGYYLQFKRRFSD